VPYVSRLRKDQVSVVGFDLLAITFEGYGASIIVCSDDFEGQGFGRLRWLVIDIKADPIRRNELFFSSVCSIVCFFGCSFVEFF